MLLYDRALCGPWVESKSKKIAVCLSHCRSAKIHLSPPWTAKSIAKSFLICDTRSHDACSHSALFTVTSEISADHYRSHSCTPLVCPHYSYSVSTPAPEAQPRGWLCWREGLRQTLQYHLTSHSVCGPRFPEGIALAQGMSRHEVGCKHRRPLFMELPAFQTWTACWLGYPRVAQECSQQPALASFVSTSVGISGCGEAVTRSLLILPPPDEAYPRSAGDLPGVGCPAFWGCGCSHVILRRHLYLARGAAELILH